MVLIMENKYQLAHTQTYTHTHTFILTYTHRYIHAYTNTYTHKHTHIYTYIYTKNTHTEAPTPCMHTPWTHINTRIHTQ